MSQTKVLFIMGMHRSGTSVLSRLMGVLGYSHGNHLMAPDQYNPNGYWEDLDIAALNDKMLEHLEMRWDAISFHTAQPELIQKLKPFTLEAEEILQQKITGQERLVIKDPRLCLLLGFWQYIALRKGISSQLLFLFRHPESVIQSLISRNEFHRGKANLLYTLYNCHAITQLQNQTYLSLSFEALVQHPAETLQYISHFLEVEVAQSDIVQAAEKMIQRDYIQVLIKETAFQTISEKLYQRMVFHSENKNPINLLDPILQNTIECLTHFNHTIEYIRTLERNNAFWADLAIQRLTIIESSKNH